MQKKNYLGLLLTLCIIGASLPVAAGPIKNMEEWRFSLMQLFPQGVQHTGAFDSDLRSNSAGLMFSNHFLRTAQQGRNVQIKSGNKDWTLFAEYQYADPDPAARMLPQYQLIDLKTQITELGASYRFANHFDTDFEVLAGTRYKTHDIAGVNAPVHYNQNIDEDAWWQHTFVGFRFFSNLSPGWTLVGRGDIGGNREGQFAWNVVAMLDYSPDEKTSIYLGYKFLDIDYANDIDTGVEPFSYTTLRQGPFIGFTYRW